MGARGFDIAARQKGLELFSLTLGQIDAFLGTVPLKPAVLRNPAGFAADPSWQIRLHQAPRSLPSTKPCIYDRDYNLALQQMQKELYLEEELHLAATISEEELEAYRQSKSVDPASILPP